MTRQINTLKLSKLLSEINQYFTQIEDYRAVDDSSLEYTLPDTLMAGLAMMFIQDPSILEFQRRLDSKHGGNNLATIFGVNKIPQTSQFRRILDNVSPDSIQKIFGLLLKALQKTRLWKTYRVLDGRYAVLLDGVEYFRSNKISCKQCLEFHHKDGRVDYAHKALVATIAHPSLKKPLPLLIEDIKIKDGMKKQDCEFNAAKRLIPNIAKQHPHLDIVYVGDGLFSKMPFVSLIVKHGNSYVLVAKPGDHTYLEDVLKAARRSKRIKSMTVNLGKGKQGIYEWICNVELNGSTDELTNWFSYSEYNSKGKRTYRNSWVTNIKPSKSNIVELALVGRQRWQIENEAFNVLKNHGYNMEHNFGHGKKNLAFVFIILNFLAYMLHQLMRLADPMFQAVMEKIGTRRGTWEHIRTLTTYLVWGNWNCLLEYILEYREDTGFNST